jgi:long-chain acyl-CoA synthetase
METSEIANFGKFFQHVTEIYGTRNAIFWRDPIPTNGDKYSYKSITGKKLKELVFHTSRALLKLGLVPGDKSAIISESRFEWVVADYSCILNRLITVPVFTTMTSSQIKYILEHSGTKVCFVSTHLLAEKVNAVFDELSDLKYIISFNKVEDAPPHTLNLEELIYQEIVNEKDSYSEGTADGYIRECASKIDPQDILTIIYTSGTTGIPKGVCLTHKNILTNIFQCQKAFSLDSSDRFLSYLPIAHSYERTTGYSFALYVGAEIYYAQTIDTLQQQFLEVKPTILTSVPLLFVRVYTRIMKSIETMPRRRKLLVKTAVSIGRRYRGNKSHILWKAADRIILHKIRERTGGSLRYVISGASALNKEVSEFFDAIGITIYEGYGMTEASPVISVNRPEKNKFGTVGKPLDGVEVKIAGDGEILVKGDTVMPGYYRNEKETNETIIDGWLHTGDIGQMDEDNYLTITDRKKSLIKSEGGEYISLTHVEDTISESKYVSQVITFAGDDKPFITALIVPDFDELRGYTGAKDIYFEDNFDLIQNQEIMKLFESEINHYQKGHAKFTRVRKFVLLPKPFTIESDEMTPTLKLKRKMIEERYKDVIDKMYAVK